MAVLPVLALAAATILAACSHPGQAKADAGRPPRAASAGPALGSPGSQSPAPTSRRDGDITDVNTLAATMAATTDGAAPWVDIFARLRAQSWLATRYPGRYDLADIYVDDAATTAQANDRQDQAMGVYLDESLPRLVSVVKTRDLGQLVELEVVLTAGPATVRGLDDDSTRGVLPGGTHRGLFTVGQDGPGGGWRIHSVTELQVVDHATTQEPNQ